MMEWWNELLLRQSLLARSGAIFLLAALAFFVLMQIDGRTVLQHNTWFKPLKFSLSIGVYFLSLAWFWPWWGKTPGMSAIAVAICALLFIEMIIIAFQAARAVPSHFNTTNALNSALFGIMGVAIFINTIIVLYLALTATFGTPEIAAGAAPGPGQKVGWQIGLWIFIAGSLLGFLMGRLMSHSVGPENVADAMPVTGWNRTGGDIRIAHFFGLHALQALPFLGWCSDVVFPRAAIVLTLIAGVAYVSFTGLMLWYALQGKSFF